MPDADLDNLEPRLDALLERARWPDPLPGAEARLRAAWLELGDGRAPRRALRISRLAAAAAAAVLLIATGGLWFIVTQSGQVPPATVAKAPHLPQIGTPTIETVGVAPPAPAPAPAPASPKIVALAPTPRETLAVLAASPAVDARAAVRDALDAAAQDDHVAAVELLRPLRPGRVEYELAVALAAGDQLPRRRAAARLLGRVGTASSLPLLTRLARDPMLAADAMPGVARLGGAEALLAIARASRDDPRRQAIGQLLTLRSESAMGEFLALVLDDAIRHDALAALRASSAPPVQPLIATLDHPRVDRRFAAAKALGSLCDRDDVGEALRAMVDQNRHRREALAALLSCPGREAATYIEAARFRASSIDAEVRAVQTELRRIF